MTTFATNEDIRSTLDVLDEREREAWSAYAAASRDLEGTVYDQAEESAWEHLQTDLEEIRTERAVALEPATAGSAE